MRMPGFTAEAGLRQATIGYRANLQSPDYGAVLPAYLCLKCGFNIWGQYECVWGECFIRAYF
jgi:hypothetical protein